MHRLRSVIGPLLSIAILLLAIGAIRSLIIDVTLDQVVSALLDISPFLVCVAVFFTAVVCVILAFYDVLAFVYLGMKVPIRNILLGSFVSNVIGFNTGLALFTGGSVRWRMYGKDGVTAKQVVKISIFGTVNFILLLLLMSGVALQLNAGNVLQDAGIPMAATRLLGALLVAIVLSYLLTSVLWHGRLVPIHRWHVRVPDVPIAFAQVILTGLEVTCIAAVLYALLPPTSLSFLSFLGLFAIAQFTGYMSQLPGGLLGFDATIAFLLRGTLPSGSVFASLIAFRVIYSLLPLLVALVIFFAHEARKAHRKIWQR
ncbi:MAG: YbhN family protein [Candidatus Peribacteraceae bacterium]|jgi:uncharacterized membrane protein YbhN (UPF0104 family)